MSSNVYEVKWVIKMLIILRSYRNFIKHIGILEHITKKKILNVVIVREVKKMETPLNNPIITKLIYVAEARSNLLFKN